MVENRRINLDAEGKTGVQKGEDMQGEKGKG
jgi:hypothetical protein